MSEQTDPQRPLQPAAGGATAGAPARIAHDVDPRRLILWTLGLVLAMAIAFLAATWLINLITYVTPSITMPNYPLTVETGPEANERLRSFRDSERTTLSSYGWINRDRGTLRIPIDRAMELTVQRGLPARPESQRPQANPGDPGSTGAAHSGRTLDQARQLD